MNSHHPFSKHFTPDASMFKILIVDDNPDNLRLLNSILINQGYEIRPAMDGALAITAAQLSPPDLILLDIRMPKMDGYEVCQRLKADERTQEIPVIFLTSLDEIDDKVKGFELGGVDYISKPFETAELLARIKTHLQMQMLQKALKLSEERFYKTFQNSPLPIALISLPEQCYIEVNRAFLQETGYELDEILGKTSIELNLWMNCDNRTQMFQLLQANGYLHGFEAEYRDKTGKSQIALLFLEIVNIHGNHYVIATGQNITQRKQTENQLAERTQVLTQTLSTLKETQEELIQSARMAALGQSVGGVAHEINTPIGTAILAASTLVGEMESLEQAIAKDLSNPADLLPYVNAAKECSRIITSNLGRAGEMIQSFKQVAVDQTSLKARSFNLQTYLKEVLLSLGPELKQTSHRMQLQGDATTTLYSYPGALAQVITNLTLNSLTHAYPHGGTGKLQLNWQQMNNEVILTYKDDGRGIAPAQLNQIFEPFFTTTYHQGGSGLGLHLVHNLVTQTLQGRISVSSQLEQGTCFTLVIPQILDNC